MEMSWETSLMNIFKSSIMYNVSLLLLLLCNYYCYTDITTDMIILYTMLFIN